MRRDGRVASSLVRPRAELTPARTDEDDSARLGATGAMLLGMLVDELERQDKAVWLMTMCIGLGMGITTIAERV